MSETSKDDLDELCESKVETRHETCCGFGDDVLQGVHVPGRNKITTVNPPSPYVLFQMSVWNCCPLQVQR